MSETAAPSLLGKIAGYTELLAKDPLSSVFVPLADAYRQMGLLGDAMDVAAQGIDRHPEFAPGFVVLGRIRFQAGETSEAAAAYQRALELDGENLAALKGLARLHLENGAMEEARRLLIRAAALRPEDVTVRRNLQRLAPVPDRDSAQASTLSAPSRRPGEPISTSTIAEIYIKQGFPERALKVYRDLLEADPHNEAIRRKLVELKRALAADESQAQQAADVTAAATAEIAAEELTAELRSTPQTEAEAPPEPRAETKAAPGAGFEVYRASLEGWLNAIHKRRAHVQ